MIGPVKTQTKSKRPTKDFDHLVGDGLRIKKNNNHDGLWIEGDGCRISLTTNYGFLRVTGDGCRVKIGRNLGSVEYTGDGGRILLGPESIDTEKVTYKGDGGVIEYGETKKTMKRPEEEKKIITTTTTTKGKSEMTTGKVLVTRVTTSVEGKRRSKAADVKVYVRVKNDEISI